MDDHLLKDAVELIRSGKKQDAQKMLQSALKADVRNISAWFWYVETCSTPEQRIQILEACAKFNPENIQVKTALDILRGQHAQTAALPGAQAGSFFEKPQASSHGPAAASQYSQKPAAMEKENKHAQAPQKISGKTRNPVALLFWLMAGILMVGVVLLAVYVLSSTPADPAQYRHTQPIEYYLYVPKAYTADHAWPLFIGIHGSGESGLDCWNLWQPYAEREGFILLCPTMSDTSGGWYQQGGERKAWGAILQVTSKYNIKPRFFMVGFSAGAQFVQGFSFAYPGSVQAAVILSAVYYYPPSRQAWDIPFLVVIGDLDYPVAIDGSMQFAQALANNGSSVSYWLLPGVGHTITNKTKKLTIDFYRAVNKP